MSLLIAVISLLLSPILLTQANEYYVTSSLSPSCPVNQECHNLSYYVSDPETYFTDNTILYFIEGTHLLEEHNMLIITETSNLTLTTWPGNNNQVHIRCTSGGGGIGFFDCVDISINGLTFSNCGTRLPDDLVDLVDDNTRQDLPLWRYLYGPTYSMHTLFFGVVHELQIHRLTMQYCRGRALSTVNTFNVNVTDSLFRYNNLESFTNPTCAQRYDNSTCYGGNVYLLYVDSDNCSSIQDEYYYINIAGSSFVHGVDRVHGFTNAGLGIAMAHTTSYGIDISITDVHLEANTAYRGANFGLSVTNTVPYHTLMVRNLTSIFGNSIYRLPINGPFFITADGTYGAGFLYHASIILILNCPNSFIVSRTATNLLNMTNSFIAHNTAHEGPGVMTNIWPGINARNRFVVIHNVQMVNNSGETGVSLLMWQYSAFQPEAHLNIDLVNVSIRDNYFMRYNTGDNHISAASAVLLVDLENATFSNVSITDNTITGLHLYNSVLTLRAGNATVANNRAVEGGGIFLRGISVMIFKPPGNLILANNSAQYGGGIYFQQTTVEDDRPLCFFQIDDPSSVYTGTPPNTHIYSINNTASIAGDFMYSSKGAILLCRLTALFDYYLSPSYSFRRLVVYSERNDYTTLSSSPIRVCLCNERGYPNCSLTTHTIDVIPGSVYNVSVVTVGFQDGVTPGIVNKVYKVNRESVQELVFRTESNCTSHSEILKIYGSNMTIELTTDQSTVPDHNYPITLHLNLLPCPLGYQFSPSLGVCSCNEYLQVDSISCNSTTWNVTRANNKWITYNTVDNCTVVYDDCPFDYCNSSSVTFPLTSPNGQCVNNRVGLLCGHCAPGYSVILGSNACQECSNAYLSLIIVFIIAGIALVVFIFVVDWTVTAGTVSGLIFYANIIKINEHAFFPDGPVPVLTIFISWINLDFGFEVCFYDGLDAFAKVWLQFAFPLYIASIVIGIIILCHYSQSVSRLAGNNAVPVLATLILLSYTKVLRTIISAMQMGIVRCNESVHSVVWLLDGTVNYFGSKHSILLLFSILVFILVAVPYTGLILLIPLVEKRTPRKLRWLLKLKPYFDATCGELQDDNRYWVGLMLLVRLILALIIPFTQTTIDTAVILVAVILIMTFVWNLPNGSIYKKRYLDLLESWYILNLGFVSVLTLSGGTRNGIIISTSLIFVTFLLVVLFHIWKRITKIDKIRNRLPKRGHKMEQLVLYFSGRRQITTQEDTKMVSMYDLNRTMIRNDKEISNVVRRRETLLYSNDHTLPSPLSTNSSGVTTDRSSDNNTSSYEMINSPVSPQFMKTEVFLFD